MSYDHRVESTYKNNAKIYEDVIFKSEWIKDNPVEFTRKLTKFLEEFPVSDWNITFVPSDGYFSLYVVKKVDI